MKPLPVLLTLLLPILAHAQDAPTYPRVNVAPIFKVDPAWPKRPADLAWAEMPGIAVDAKDNVYVFTRAKPPVQVFDASGKFLRAWGDHIASSHHIRIDPKGHVWTTDIERHLVQKHTPLGKLLLTLGTPDKAGRDNNHFYMPTDVAFSPAGDIFVSDGYGNARIVHFDPEGNFKNAWGGLGHAKGQFSIPHTIAAIKDRIYVGDRNNARIQVFSQKGDFLEEWTNLIIPWGFAVTPKDELWVCGSSPAQWRKDDKVLGVPPADQILMRFTPQGKLLQLVVLHLGIEGKLRPGELNWVHAIAPDSQGNLYLGDIKGKRAQKFTLKLP